MRLGLGIDAGGTYTDTVLYDFSQKLVLGKGKALTTKDDYAVGIAASLAQIAVDAPETVDLVVLSTTLATNALVAGKGARAGLLLIGYDRELVERFLQVGPYWIVAGGHDMRGQARAVLDENEVRRVVEAMAQDVEVIAVSEMGGAVNPEHEHRVQTLVQEEYSIPVIAGHEISSEMDSMKRATTVFWNARLIPILLALIEAVEAVLNERGISASIMLERSDGTLMGKELARRRPIETLMSGPVASIYGALHLTGCENALVIDMGGTTTDIGIVRKGQPRLRSSGARIGAYRTTVKTLDLHTVGLGGDSEISITGNGELAIGPQRVVPLSYAARLSPAIAEELGSWEKTQVAYVDAELLPAVEFFIPARKGIDQALPVTAKDALGIGEREESALRALQALGGASRFRLAEAIGYAYPSLLRMDYLESCGLAYRVGLTPTDILHVMDKLELWEASAARQGVEAFARRWHRKVDAICEAVVHTMEQRLAEQVLNAILAETISVGEHPNGRQALGGGAAHGTRQMSSLGDCPICEYLLYTSLNGVNALPLECNIELKVPIVAVGAPVKAYFPSLANALKTELCIPEHADVANAIGAITGNIALTVEIIVSATGDDRYIIQGIPENNSFDALEEASAAAIIYAAAKAKQRAIEAGAESVSVDVTQEDLVSQIGDESCQAIFLEKRIIARGTGRPQTRV